MVHTFIVNAGDVKNALSLCLIFCLSLLQYDCRQKSYKKIPFYDVFSKCLCSFSTSQFFLRGKPFSEK